MDNLGHSSLFSNIHKNTDKFSKGRKKYENVWRALFNRIGHI